MRPFQRTKVLPLVSGSAHDRLCGQIVAGVSAKHLLNLEYLQQVINACQLIVRLLCLHRRDAQVSYFDKTITGEYA